MTSKGPTWIKKVRSGFRTRHSTLLSHRPEMARYCLMPSAKAEPTTNGRITNRHEGPRSPGEEPSRCGQHQPCVCGRLPTSRNRFR
jgi:hypothetical protein